jgi:two-component system, sensor histidine kinase
VPFRRAVRERPWLITLNVVDLTGRNVCTSANRLIPGSVADREYFQRALATRSFVVSDLVISRRLKKPVIVAVVPRVVNGTVESIVSAALDIHYLSRLSAGLGGDTLLTDSKGTVVAAHPKPEWIGKSLASRSEFWKAISGPDAVIETAALGGPPRLVAHTKLTDTGSVLVISRERRDILASPNANARAALGNLALISLFCFLGVWLGASGCC